MCIRSDFQAVMRFTASRWFTDSIYPFKCFAFLILFPKTEYCLSPFKKMRCFDKKQSISRKIVQCAGDQTTHSIQLHSFRFRDSRVFLCSLLLLHCAFLLLKLLFSFFPMTFSVSTVHFREFILFGGTQIILHSCRSLAIDSTLDARV